ncbi:hypothetical protein B0H11DRAFT_2229677 [Mycena galericulata]|nr:hypothetical protein B0H11DRAFT_2229677 [Mycena galericulata]
MSARVHRVLKLSRPRFFSSSNDWISPLIVISRGLVSASNCVPYPYINTALTGGLALLELIQTVGQTTDDLKYLAESVVTIMKLLREEMDSHPTNTSTHLSPVCMEFNMHLTRLSTDIETMSKDWSSSKFKKYLKVNSVRDEITHFTRRVTDMRANATQLIAATGTRMDLAGVANAVAEVQSSVLEMRTAMGSTTTDPNRELVRFEEDFHALKIGDIELDFESARTSTFMSMCWAKSERTEIGWTDYRGYVRGSPRTIRIYDGSDPTESWKGFLSLLAEWSSSPHLSQLFGFCSSPRLRSLVFHGEYRSLDEYAINLQSPRALVEWETTLIKDFLDIYALHLRKGYYDIFKARSFASVKADTGKLMLMHLENMTNTSYIVKPVPWNRVRKSAHIK